MVEEGDVLGDVLVTVERTSAHSIGPFNHYHVPHQGLKRGSDLFLPQDEGAGDISN